MRLLAFLAAASIPWMVPLAAQAASLTFVSDTIGTSIPGAPANHTIRFTTTVAIPANGTIRITPALDAFKIPTTLGLLDVDLAVNGIEQTLGPLPLLSIVGVSVIAGTQGSITFTFPSARAAGSIFLVKIGKHASIGGTGIERIRNPVYQGSYRIMIDSYNVSGVTLDRASAMIATLFPVRVATSLPVAAEKNAAFEPAVATTTTLTNANGTLFKVTTPADFVSFSDEIQLSISAFTKEDVATLAPPPSGKREVGAAYELALTRLSTDSMVTSFSQNVTFDFYYTDADFIGIDESTLAAYKWNGTAWAVVSGSAIHPSENRVSVQVSSFSMYTVMGTTAAGGGSSGGSGGGGGSSGGGGGGGGSPPPATSSRKGDINGDGHVNLIDFSIAAFWFKKQNPPASVDMNGDGLVTLVDFSIMAFYWNS